MAPNELFDKFLEDRLSPEERTELCDLLERDAEAGRQFVEYVAETAVMLGAASRVEALSRESAIRTTSIGWSRWSVRAPLLAAAASLLLALGLWWGMGGSRERAGRSPEVFVAGFSIANRAGSVQADGGRIVLGADSFCLLKAPDGSVVAVGADSRADLARDPTTGGLVIQHDAGRLYLDRVRREEPWTLKLGGMSVELLGTRLCAIRDGRLAKIQVLAGEVRMVDPAGVGTLLGAGQTLVSLLASSSKVSGIEGVLFVRNVTPGEAELAWLERAGVKGAIRSPGDVSTGPGPAGFAVVAGRWKVSSGSGATWGVRREDKNGSGSVLLGESLWTQGVLTGSLRILDAGANARVGIGFVAENAPDQGQIVVMRKVLQDHLDAHGTNGWFDVRAEFEVLADGRVSVSRFVLQPEDRKLAGFGIYNWVVKNPSVRLERCGLILFCSDVSVEAVDLAVSGRSVKDTAWEPGAGNPEGADVLRFYWGRAGESAGANRDDLLK